MAGDMNVVALCGRLTRESDLKYSQGGTAVCRFTVAINRRKRNGDKWEDEANFFDCVYFGKAAEAVNQYLEKGRQVTIVGELHQSKWEQDGQNRSRVEIFVNNLTLVGSAGGQSGSRPQANDYGSNRQQSSYAPRATQAARPVRQAPSSTSVQAPSAGPDFGMGPEAYADDDDNVPF